MSKTPSLFGHDEPCLIDDMDVVKNFRSLLNKIRETGPVMLVLDNVCPGSESLIDDFQVQVPDCKILITSRVEFPRFSSLFLKPLRDDDAVTLFCRFALPNDATSYVPAEKYVKQVCYIHLISLILSPIGLFYNIMTKSFGGLRILKLSI